MQGVVDQMVTVMKELKIGMEKRGVRFLDEGREQRLPGLLYPDDLVLCGESEVDIRAMVGSYVEVYKRICLKVNGGENKVMMLRGSCE